MKSIKLTSNAFKGKDYIVSVPVVVKPAVTRNLAYNLKEAMNTDPQLGLVLSDSKYQDIYSSQTAGDILDDLVDRGIVIVEELFDPAEYLSDTTKYQKQDLEDPEGLPSGLFLKIFTEGGAYSAAYDPADLLDLRPNSLVLISENPSPNLQIESVLSLSYGNSGMLKIPVQCELVTPVPAGVTLARATDKGGDPVGPYFIDIDSSYVQEGTSFNIKVTLDMANARVHEDVNDETGTALTNPKVLGWRASKVFKAAITLAALPEE